MLFVDLASSKHNEVDMLVQSRNLVTPTYSNPIMTSGNYANSSTGNPYTQETFGKDYIITSIAQDTLVSLSREPDYAIIEEQPTPFIKTGSGKPFVTLVKGSPEFVEVYRKEPDFAEGVSKDPDFVIMCSKPPDFAIPSLSKEEHFKTTTCPSTYTMESVSSVSYTSSYQGNEYASSFRVEFPRTADTEYAY
eukprot:TRINITY_DN4508_c0_g1_i1.p1 TRINITY_DN4508_c0_g1~~TRINITY_DN4508_c0_g1_i1.p1  ORF type:complete len:192 (+),score=24.85 TRINITY_DN4508_c0_g1_i1:41-616(+)